MNNNTNIKQAEMLSGVSKRNIRFYEQKGLIHPSRNQDNDYRAYTQEDIEKLKLIRMLRMVDMPLDQIQSVLKGEQTLSDAAAVQKNRLALQTKQLETAIRFCGELELSKQPDVDAFLRRMAEPDNKKALFTQWAQDYRSFARAQGERAFTFIPDIAITNASEFTLALCQYGEESKRELVITKEGMYPEFTLDGIEYTAERIYTSVCRVPTAIVRCTALHPEQFGPVQPAWKKVLLSAVHYGWIVLVLIVMNFDLFFGLSWSEVFSTWEGWFLIFAMLILMGVELYQWYRFHYNEKPT